MAKLDPDTEAVETQDDVDETTDTTIEAEDGGESADGEDGEDGDGEEDAEESEEAEEDEGDAELGKRAQKRIQKLNGQKKDLEKKVQELEEKLEEAQKTGGDDAETYVSAAKSAGILPHLMTQDLAEAIEKRSNNKRALAYYEDFLDGDDDFLTLGEKEYSRKDVRKRVRQLREENEQLEKRFGEKEAKIRKQVKEIFDLGQKALKAGWKPGATVAKTKQENLKTKPTKGATLAAAKTRKGGETVDYAEVGSAEDMEAMIIASMEKE